MNTTQMNAKKTWTKPQLLVLVRNNPEEAVLLGCKGTPTTIDPEAYNDACTISNCFGCLLPGTS